ncbi:MAG: hypothetical protein J0H02_05715 [Armatimonadetes bacterium]|nr:hypothetical protein [Armatimonadota bacterium]
MALRPTPAPGRVLWPPGILGGIAIVYTLFFCFLRTALLGAVINEEWQIEEVLPLEVD